MNKNFILNEGKNKAITKSKKFAMIVICLFSLVLLFDLVSASQFGYNSPSGSITIGGNKTINNTYITNTNGMGVNATQLTNVSVINIKESWLETFINSIIDVIFTQVSQNVSSINSTRNIQELLNWTGIYNVGSGDFSFTDFHNSFVLNASILNNTANIQNLLNSTGIYSIPLTINSTKNIQELLNSTGVYQNSFVANLTQPTCAAGTVVSGVNANGSVICTTDATGVVSYTNLAWINQSNNFVGWQNFSVVNATSILLGGINISSWIYNISFNWTAPANTYTDLRITAVNTTAQQALTINTTANIGNLYNATASMIANLSISQLASGGDFSFTDFHNSFVLNASILNNTANIGNLYNATASMIANTTFTQNFTLQAVGALYNSTALIFAQMNNNTNTIGQLYNVTASMIANTTFTQNFTLQAIGALYNATASMIANLSISQLGGDFKFTDFHNSFVLNASILNNTKNIGNLYNATALMFAQMNNNTNTIGQLYNVTASMIANTTFTQNFTLQAVGALYNSTALIFAQMNNNTNTIGQLYNVTASMIANTTFTQNFTLQAIGALYNATASMIANLSISQLGGDFKFTDFHNSFVLNASILNNTKNIQNLINATLGMFNLSNFNLAIAVNTTAQQALTINTTANIGNLYNATALMIAQIVNTTNVHQLLLNGSVMYFAGLNITTNNFTVSQGIGVLANKSVYLGVREMYSNDTCVIIKGKTSTLEIC